MIIGTVNQRLQMIVPVVLVLEGRPELQIEFVLDTGFEGAMTLPAAAVTALDLPFYQETDAFLADGTSVKTEMYRAKIQWQGKQENAAVLAMGHTPLLGTAILAGCELTAQFFEGGVVEIERIV